MMDKGGMDMQGVKLYFAAVLLLLAAALRILFPDTVQAARAWLGDTLDPEGTGRELAATLGRELDGFELPDGLVSVFFSPEDRP